MTTTWAKEMATQINAVNNCKKTGNTEWETNHNNVIRQLLDRLPHGSGLDGQWTLESNSTSERIVLRMEYHAMNEGGYYDGWIPFTLTVTASLQFGVQVNITGKFGKYQDIKDYLYDSIDVQAPVDTSDFAY